MESEIAELESFIDSYVGEQDTSHIQSETFTNSSVNQELYDFYDKDFEEELKEHQKLQDFILSNESFQYDANGSPNAIDFMPDIYPQLVTYNGDSMDPKSQLSYDQNPSFFPYRQNETVCSAPHNGSVYPTVYPLHFNSPEFQLTRLEENSHPSVVTRKHISENDLRHRLNKKEGNSQSTEHVGTRKKKVPNSSRGRHKRTPPESRFNHRAINDQSDRSGLAVQGQETYQQIYLHNRQSSHPSSSERRKKPFESRFNHNALNDQIDHSSLDIQDKGPHQQKSTNSSLSRHSSHSSSSESVGCSKNRIVSGRSKSEVVSWLHQDSISSKQSIERKLKNMNISRNSDLSKLVKSANSYITSEEKMKQVAVMICTKAMRNPQTAESGALLCNEMSHRMVNGTSFRTVLLNIVQSHFKNRHQLIKQVVENDKDNDWCGFVNFLTQLFLHLRTRSNERLRALINPVYDCLLLILEEKSLNYKLSKCFLDNVQIAGSILNELNPQKMTQLMSVLRDNCVLPGNLTVEVRRNLLQCLEYYARGWKEHALDASYYTTFCERS